MSDHQHHDHQHQHQQARTIERHCDVAVIGGSAAGLAAALQLGRQRRAVIVVDAGDPRNAPAAHMHSFLGHEGIPPSELAAIGRDEVRRYGVEVVPALATAVHRRDDRFVVELAGGNRVVARRVLAATGITDELPAIDGLAPHWGRDVIHCPFCHGYEVRDQRIVAVVTHPMGLHPARLFRQLSDRFTVVVHDGAIDPDHPDLAALGAAGVEVVHGTVTGIASGPDGRLAAVELAEGRRIEADAVAVGPRWRARAEALAPLGLEPVRHVTGLGDHIETTSTGETSVAGVFAAGNVTDPSQQVLQAAANGSWVGAMIAFSLADEDLAAAARPSGNETDWDHRYGGGRMWSGNPNGTLVAEVAGMAPGRALDVGAGEGGDAVWLAEHGWQVTASDISQRALDHVAGAAAERNLEIGYLHADANARAPFEPGAFDLVSAQYASIPRTPDGRGVQNLLAAVAPGGTLLVVSHDLAPMRAPVDVSAQSRPFDPDAYVRVEDVAAALAASPAWTVELNEKRPRPPGAASSHHVDDVVLRARRLHAGTASPG
ncbi:MAG: bifunctional NAD(P)/FAD-dependent oxidoreductase/class I SAM-dependent methyltransferase [Acidimicrobiales bacterium]